MELCCNLKKMNDGYKIRGGRVIDPASGRDEISDICIINGIIANPEDNNASGLKIIDASGLVIGPGFMDLHVHLREPGNEPAETIESGSRAAVQGGFTTIISMPNTSPPLDSPARIKAQIVKADSIGLLNILPSGCITTGRQGKQLADLIAMTEAGAIAFTDDGNCVADWNLMLEAMSVCKELGRTVMDHSLDPHLAGNGCMRAGPVAESLGLKGIPAAAETSIVERNIELAKETGCRIHIQHVSCADSVRLIRSARKEGLPVSGEATPHHLIFTDEDIISPVNTEYKMNPPLGTRKDRDALLEGIADNTISAFATDHAPHTAESKSQDFSKAPFGVTGLETALAATYTHTVKTGLIQLIDWVGRWTTGPAEILGLAPPLLSPGQPANLTIFDPSEEWTVTAQAFRSRSSNSPFINRTLTGRTVHTFFRGKISGPAPWPDGI